MTGSLHLHDTGDDHYHDEDDYGLDHDPRLDGLWLSDNVELISVGIDIGSSGTQLVFSRIRMQRMGRQLSSRYQVVERELLYQSPVSLTPYSEGLTIDSAALGRIVAQAYDAAGMVPDAVDTGALILTGEALRRENAPAIAELLAGEAGDLVCTMAGHHLEAMLAAYGSGAAWASGQTGQRILNIDIGGGTTKYAVIESGRILQTAAIPVGGRLHVFANDGALTRLEPAGQVLARQAALDWQLGTKASNSEKAALAETMARDIVAAARTPDRTDISFLTEPLSILDGITGVMFSGGVSEYVYGHESRDFSDMGRLVGAALARMAAEGRLPWPLLPAGAGIRATALGLSEYSVQLSGNTIHISDPGRVLPRRNLRVARPDCDLSGVPDPLAIAAAITSHIAKYDLAGEAFALAFAWRGEPTYPRIAAFAKGVALALADGGDKPIAIILDGDIARTLGRLLSDEMHVTAPLLVVDGVDLADFDYVDIGRVRQPSGTVPITIKSLLFSKDPRAHHAAPR